ncbi:MAG: PsbP-related protein, partial [Patescibacteria group bacterium]
IILGAIVVVLAAGGYYFLAQENGNTNSSNAVTVTNTMANENVNGAANANTASNINTAPNTNEATNTNTKVDTSDWLTYENKEHGYSISYPANWNQYQRLGDDIVFAEESGKYPEISIESMSKESTTFELQKGVIAKYVLDQKIQKELSIAGRTAYLVSGISSTSTQMVNKASWPLTTVIVDYNDYIIQLSGRDCDEIFNQSINSFK